MITNTIKKCKVTGKILDPIKQKKSGSGLFIGPFVKRVYKETNCDIEKTNKILQDSYWIEESYNYYSNWMSASRALTMIGFDEQQKKIIYNREFKPRTKCQLILCNERVPYNMKKKGTCCLTHYNQFYKIRKGDKTIDDYNISCCECSIKFPNYESLGKHISKYHSTLEEYYIKHQKKTDEEGFCLWCKNATRFNSINNGYNKFCYNTNCNVYYYNKVDNRHQKCKETISRRLKETQNMPNQIGYWLKKGYTEEQAKALVSERQTTNSIKSIIRREKCSQEEAIQKRADITEKWLKSFPKQNYSKVSQELFWSIFENIKDDYKDIYFATYLSGVKSNDEKNHEYKIKTKTTIRSLDFYIKDINKVIEFNGAYWHSIANRNVNYTVDKDIKRNKEIQEILNCKLLVVNELDYYKNKDKIIQECLEFLKNEC